MSALKRPSSRGTRLITHASPYHPSVTLFEQDDDVEPGPRRSKRIKLEAMEQTAPVPVRDIESEVQDAGTSISESLKPEADNASKPTSSSSKSARKPKSVKKSLDTPHPAPADWRETYDTIKEMRSRFVAPVDTKGCDQAQLKETDPKVSRTCILSELYSNFCFRTSDLPP